MSKSRGNVVNPDDVVKQYGADTARIYTMFMGPFEQMIPWDGKGIVGCRRFIEKVYKLTQTSVISTKNEELESLLHKTIKKVGEDIDATKFNTAISALMEFVNKWQVSGGLYKKDAEKFLILLSPFAPHVTEELWKVLKRKGMCLEQRWPKYDEDLVKEKNISFIIQINGKVRDRIEVAGGVSQKEAEKIVMKSAKIKPWLKGKTVVKIIFVPDKLINIVCE